FHPQYQQPTYEQPQYQQPSYSAPTPSYEQPQYQQPTYEQPKYEQPKGYEQPKDSYSAPAADCKSATAYFEATGSPTLKQCISIVCGAPGQTEEYKKRGIEQCHALKKQAEATSGGHLPKGW
ncbi:hypothetical protein HK097_011509, partial [Rhizophlyctis rosea]